METPNFNRDFKPQLDVSFFWVHQTAERRLVNFKISMQFGLELHVIGNSNQLTAMHFIDFYTSLYPVKIIITAFLGFTVEKPYQRHQAGHWHQSKTTRAWNPENQSRGKSVQVWKRSFVPYSSVHRNQCLCYNIRWPQVFVVRVGVGVSVSADASAVPIWAPWHLVQIGSVFTPRPT